MVTTSSTGRVFAFGHAQLRISCSDLTQDCGYTLGLYLDGQPIAGSAHLGHVSPDTTEDQSAELFGIANGVGADTHHITIAYEIRTLFSRPSIVSIATETRSAALALGR